MGLCKLYKIILLDLVVKNVDDVICFVNCYLVDKMVSVGKINYNVYWIVI